ncbi:antitoxin PrlF [Oxalobacteraceae bacterium GrIS 2.11]
MSTAKLGSKGRVTIPAKVRAALRLETGSRIEFIETTNGEFLMIPITSSSLELKGMLPKPAKAVSIDDMN